MKDSVSGWIDTGRTALVKNRRTFCSHGAVYPGFILSKEKAVYTYRV